jgi:hypothetical protein
MTAPRPTQADMNWFAILPQHARRTPDRPLTVLGRGALARCKVPKDVVFVDPLPPERVRQSAHA